MSTEAESRDYEVGQGKPPPHSKWKPGQSGNPNGRPRKTRPDAASVAAILDGPVDVLKGGVPKKMPAFEASVRKLVSRTINDYDIQATRAFLKLCDKYGVIEPATEPTNYFQVPSDWDWDEWMEIYHRLGAPPWPGKRSGLPTNTYRNGEEDQA